MKSLKIKKGDRVKVIAGNDKGAIGEVLSVDPARERVVVEGVNIRKHHRRDMPPPQGGTTKGGIISSEAPIHVSKRSARDQDRRQGRRDSRRLPSRGRHQASPRRL